MLSPKRLCLGDIEGEIDGLGDASVVTFKMNFFEK